MSLAKLPVARSIFRNTHGAPSPGKKGRPRNPWQSEQRVLSPAKDDSLNVGVSSDSSQNVENMRLLHHFMTRKPDSPDSSQDRDRDPLHHQALLLAFIYPCILHLIYEFSALDLARERPQQEAHYRSLAERYSTAGLQGATDLIRRMDSDDYLAIYTSASLACINFFAKGPLAGEYLFFNENGPPQWLPLIWGIRTIIDLIGIEKIAAGVLGETASESPERATETKSLGTDVFKCPRLDWIGYFEGLKKFVATSIDPDFAIDVDALQKLSWCYAAMYGEEDASFSGDANQQNLFIWPYQLHETFAQRIQEKKPIPLIITAHFALLLQNYEFIWYVKGWSDHIIKGVTENLDLEYHHWLQWPIEQARMIREAREATIGYES